MARKKAEVEETEVMVEATVEEKPKKTRKKKVEEPVEAPVEEKIEEPKVEEPKVEEPKVEEVKPAPVEVKQEIVSVEFESYKAKAKAGLQIFKSSKATSTKVGFLKPDSKFIVLEEDGNFGRIGADKWVLLNYIEKI